MKDNFDLQLYNMLPPIYRKEDAKIRPNPEPLKRFLKILHEGGFKPLIQEIDSHQNLMDIDVADSRYLHLLVQTLGLDFPYNMTDKERRKYLKIIPSIYKSKGTADSFNFLAREIFSTKTNINTRAEVYEEGMTPEEWRRIFIDIEVDGALPDLQRKEENFRKFVELVRPVNRILVINLILMYYDNYRFDGLVRDLYDFDKLIFNEGEDELLRAITDSNFDLMSTDYATDLFDFTKVTTNYPVMNLADLSADVHDTKARTRMYFSGINLQDSERSDDRTQVTTAKSMNTNITLTRTSSKLVTSRKLTTGFYTTNYDPISLNLGY